MSSMSTSFRLFSPKLAKKPIFCHPLSPIYKTQILLPHPLFSLFSSPISFQRLTCPPTPHPILIARSHPQQQQSDTGSGPSDVTALLPPALREIVALFQSVGDDPRAKYQQLLYYGSQLPPLDPSFKDNEHRVRGCVSQVWVRAFPDPADPATVRFEADSDSALTKGLAALLVFGLSGSPASVISSVPPEFVFLLGLRQSLTPSRNNGFLNMLRLMQQKALEVDGFAEEDYDLDGEVKNLSTNVNGWRPLDYAASMEKIDGSGAGAEKDVNFNTASSDGRTAVLEDKVDEGIDVGGHGNGEYDSPLVDGDVDGDSSSISGGSGGRRERIKRLLEGGLSPVELDVEDISHLHSGHAGIGGSRTGETHFNVRVVSEEFDGKSMVKRHRLVYDLLQDELQSGLHALSIVAKTPSEAK